MPNCTDPNIVCGWVSSDGNRGTLNILWSCFSTIWLCTWTSLCLNITDLRSNRGWRFIWYKFRWQLFAVFFPEVLVAAAAEQWVSARQSVAAFKSMEKPGGGEHEEEWTMRHAFFADMGGIMIAPRRSEHLFPVDAHQLAHLVRLGHLGRPRIPPDDIRAVNKADGLARVVTMGQMAWFCVNCVGRYAQGLSICPLELETLCFILCTTHTFFFWYHKPLDPVRAVILAADSTLDEICGPFRRHAPYKNTPLDFIKPPPDPKSLMVPFWFGFKVVFDHKSMRDHNPLPSTSSTSISLGTPRKQYDKAHRMPKTTIANSEITPPGGMSWPLTIYLLVFQLMYYGLHIIVGYQISFPTHADLVLWEVSNIVDMVLIAIFVIALGLGTYFLPLIGRVAFGGRTPSTVMEAAELLPFWAKVLVHAPFVLGYIVARLLGLIEAAISLRALSSSVYSDVIWSNFIPHM
ncbi:hypothetical protein MCOR07_005734 [Pyricularia oryzae]|nr:hypothetical protein MCOR01_004426 [Pyricularia oryzae]KAI6256808.1 hypothetical protein MCOR19_006752 [Pyricularia oryzae]KAI6275393.1 hypothetical protein MCOR26_006056 [Pyricularia oryzae]KAI6314240.1 hypothetical protein MCOR34_005030 [Pyricularia oryzae]KAI6320106.1 hypothetical protein MCOR29_005423 [Pyricularia oryzae]